MNRIFSVFTALVLAVSFAAPAAAAETGRKINLLQVKEGDTWTYLRKGGEEATIRILKIEGERMEVDYFGSRRVLTREGNEIEGPSRSSRPITYDPYLAYSSFPLYQGKKWSVPFGFSTTGSQGGSIPGSGEAKGRVGEWTKITVPAGEFEVLPVRVQVYWRTSYESGSFETTCWMAENMPSPVKCKTGFGEYELKNK